MAFVNAYNGYGLNMVNGDLSNDARYGVTRGVYSNVLLNGTIYPSAYEVEMNINGQYVDDIFAGNFSTTTSGVVTGGTVSAFYELAWNGSAWILANSITGFNYSAVDVYNAAVSGVQSQTTQIVVNMLSGNDVINGSTGNDVFYGGIGNDLIRGGGGTDTALYMGNISDYTIVKAADGSTVVIDNNYNINDGVDTLYNVASMQFMDRTVAVNDLVVHPNNVALSGSVTGPHNFIDMLNFVASYGDLINAFGTNQQAGQNWYNTSEKIENRVETFDGLDYVASYPDLMDAFKSAGSRQAVLDAGATHFIQSGYREGRTTTFNGLDYIASYGDLIRAFGANGDAGAYHYIEAGHNEGRTSTFDGLDYIASYGDLINAFGANEQAGAAHFIQSGYSEGRTTTFDGLAYIANYTDLMNAFGANNDAGATHFIQCGMAEGRSSSFNVAAYESVHPDLIGKYASDDTFLAAYINTYKTTGTFLT